MEALLDKDPSTLTDAELVRAVAWAVQGFGVMACHAFRLPNPYEPITDALYDEAIRRGKPELYEKGYQRA
jgi:hypothetical protein